MTQADQFNSIVGQLVDLAAGDPLTPECIRAMVAQCYCTNNEYEKDGQRWLEVTFFDGSSVTFGMESL
jgi:hypothetical protein